MTDRVRAVALVSGRVQGVGFRAWVREQALDRGLTGHAHNLRDGRVEVDAQGPRAGVDGLLAALDGDDAPGRVTGVAVSWPEPQPSRDGFRTG